MSWFFYALKRCYFRTQIKKRSDPGISMEAALSRYHLTGVEQMTADIYTRAMNGWKKQKMPHKVSGSKWTQWKYHWNRNLYERSQRSLDENGNHSGTAVKGFKKSEYKIDFMAVPSINNTTWFVFETNTMEHHRNWCFIQRLQQPIVGIQLFSDNPLLNGKRKI